METKRNYSAINTLTKEVVFTGTLDECREKIITDKTGLLQLQ